MIVTRIYDHDVIRSIMTRDDIWSTIAEDGQKAELFEPNIVTDCWLLFTVEDETVALYNLHANNAVTVEIHAQVLPEHRKAHSKATGLAVLEWIYNNVPEYQKVIAHVPVIYENVKKFTCSFGFREEGVNRMSYMKNGQLMDRYLLGITREEIAEVIK